MRRGPGAADAHAALGSGEAGRTFQLVREWEAKAALSDSQLEALERIAELCANRPLPDHLAERCAQCKGQGLPAFSAALAS